MGKYVLKRILLALLTCFIVLSLTYILISCLRVQKIILPTENQIYAAYHNQVNQGFLIELEKPTDAYGELIDTLTLTINGRNVTYYWYSKPVMSRYFIWLKNIVTKWNWGTSTKFREGADTMKIIEGFLPTTIKINIVSVLISVPLGIGLGVLCALKKNSIFDNITQVVTMILIAIPGFVLISFAILVTYNVDWIPSAWPQSTDPFWTKVAAYIIPTFVLTIGSIFGWGRFVRAELCEVLESDYLLLARTKGLTRGQAIMRHAFRNAMVPVLPSVVSEFISILGGSMILENLYGIPGVGRLYMAAFTMRDYNLLMTDMAFYEIIGLLSGIVVDLSYGFIDPRIRMGASK